ncbi:MAG: electron transfer flavoprotein subunit alpha/FixB family protein [Anaerolineae bacterium]|nr:electron transfer flavoprotein subunit alpha/FixB family protein [Anaerolineae bacterium]
MDMSYLDLLMAQQEEVSEAEGGGGVWVVADLSTTPFDHAQAELKAGVVDGAVAPVTLEALGMARTLADALGAYVYGVLLGDGVSGLAQTLYQAGADGVRVADHPSLARFALEPYLAVLADLFEAEQPEVVLFGATGAGQELAARLAQRLGGGLIEHVTAVRLDEATRTVEATFPIYGGEYFEIAACPEARPQFLTIEPGAFPAPFIDSYRQGEPTMIEVEPVEPAVRVLGPAEDFEPPALALAQAPVIVAAGRQAGDFELVRQLAAALGGRVAGDRGARDAGWIGPEQVVDVRGVTVAPQVYVAVGIRGDTFHDAAIADARFIAAIHPDPDAPIFQVADLCLEAEPAEVLPALLKALRG